MGTVLGNGARNGSQSQLPLWVTQAHVGPPGPNWTDGPDGTNGTPDAAGQKLPRTLCFLWVLSGWEGQGAGEVKTAG